MGDGEGRDDNVGKGGVETAVRVSLSAILTIFLILSVFYATSPFLFPGKPESKAFFTTSKLPKECVMERGFPEYEIHILKGSGYDTYLSYNGSLSGMYVVSGRAVNASYVCTRLMDIVDGKWVLRNETRKIVAFIIDSMKRVER